MRKKSIAAVICIITIVTLSACSKNDQPAEPQETQPQPTAAPSPVVYHIKGTAPSITGSREESLLNWRKEARQYAEKFPNSVFVNMDPSEKAVYLTFDDGPDTANTVKVMETLMEKGVGGTFFFTGVNIKNQGSIAKQVYENGFAIGLHSYDHHSLAEMSAEEIEKDLSKTNDLLQEATGAATTIMRPPYGDINDDAIHTINSMGITTYLWSIDTLDWAQKDKNDILRNIKENLRPGDIVLMHSASGQPLASEILPEIIDYIQEQGYEIKNLPV